MPSADGTFLAFSSGLFPEAAAFEAITRQMTFARGEGLPGRAWAAGHPIMMRELIGSYFKRAAAARAIDLTCAVACPVFQGDALRCVVVFLMGGAPSTVGSVELWRNDSRLSSDMSLVDGFFGMATHASALEALTRDGWLARGTGAPGLAWQKGEAIFIPDIAQSRQFLRKQVALALGIGRALALPCTVLGTSTWVLSMLSAASAPIARRFEIWRASSQDANALVRTAGVCETAGELACGAQQSHPLDALGAIGQTWLSAVAQADAQLLEQGSRSDQADLRAAGISSVMALPVMMDDAVNEVVALYF